jgi:hypothetical protein
MYLMAIEYTNLFQSMTLQNLPNLGFLVWFENIPSGNPGRAIAKTNETRNSTPLSRSGLRILLFQTILIRR